MKILVELPDIVCASYSYFAKKMGYDSRQHLIETIFMKQFEKLMDQYPEAQHEVAPAVSEKLALKKFDQPWKPTIMPPVSEDDLKEIFGDDLEGFNDRSVAPELPEL